MQNVDYSSTASSDEKRKERQEKLYHCQEGGICDRSRVVPNAGGKYGDS